MAFHKHKFQDLRTTYLPETLSGFCLMKSDKGKIFIERYL